MASTKKVEVEEKKDEKYFVMLPPARDKEENFVLVGINGEATKLMRGVPLYVSKEVKEVLDNSRVAMKFLEQNQAKAGKKLS